MRQIRLGRTGLKVSELCLGTIALGAQPIDPVLDTFLEAGGTFIDTADTYGPEPGIAESSIGNWLSRKGHRDQIVLATKGGGSIGRNTAGRGLNRRHLLSAVEDSLRRLRTDWIDLYQTNFPDPETPVIQINFSRGKQASRFFKLLPKAPLIVIFFPLPFQQFHPN